MIDPRIPLGIQSVDIGGNYLAGVQGRQQIQRGQMQNQLAQMQLRQAQNQDMARNALSSYYMPGATDEQKESALGQVAALDPERYAEIQKSFREADAAKLEQAREQQSALARVLQTANDPQSWDRGVQFALQNGLIDEEMARQEIGKFDPQRKQMYMTQALKMKEMLDMELEQRKFSALQGHRAATRAETARHNRATEARQTEGGSALATARQRDLVAAGYKPGTPEYEAMMRRDMGLDEQQGNPYRDLTAARQVYETMYPKSFYGERVAGAPEFAQWYERDWKQIRPQPAQQQPQAVQASPTPQGNIPPPPTPPGGLQSTVDQLGQVASAPPSPAQPRAGGPALPPELQGLQVDVPLPPDLNAKNYTDRLGRNVSMRQILETAKVRKLPPSEVMRLLGIEAGR